MIRQHGWKALLVAGLAGLGGITVYMVFRSFGTEPERISLVKPLACSACGHCYEGSISRPPLKCLKCSQESVWPAMRCAKCGAVVVCDRRRFRQENRDPYCPSCGATQMASIPSGEFSSGRPPERERSQ